MTQLKAAASVTDMKTDKNLIDCKQKRTKTCSSGVLRSTERPSRSYFPRSFEVASHRHHLSDGVVTWSHTYVRYALAAPKVGSSMRPLLDTTSI